MPIYIKNIKMEHVRKPLDMKNETPNTNTTKRIEPYNYLIQ